jgi:GNAT superfamily N-acetyltransferase
MSNYTFRKLEPENIKDLYRLFEAVYHKSCPQNYYDLKYNTAYTGVTYIGFLAYHDQMPVAYYGIVPTFVAIAKQKVLGAQSCDTMTHPSHQKKGLFTNLAKKTFDLAKEKGIHFVFGFPNQNSYPGFIRHLDFTHADTMNRYTIRFSNTPFKLLYRKLGLINRKKQAQNIDNALIEEGYDGVIYDKAYLAYKSYNPNMILPAGDQRFWVNLSKGAWIGALAPLKKEFFSQTSVTLENLTKASSITFMVSSGNAVNGALSKISRAEKGFAVITKNLSGTYDLNRLKFQFSDIDIF